ncbi:MAG: hypothetical protein JO081_10250 [Alphaproteobacteria bacterium]|nr:hypothetical protein [Alphaproteobacteria bacterium]
MDVVGKPYRCEELANKIRQVIGASAACFILLQPAATRPRERLVCAGLTRPLGAKNIDCDAPVSCVSMYAVLGWRWPALGMEVHIYDSAQKPR